MKRGIPATIYNFLVDYGFVAVLILAGWVWLKTSNLYFGVAVFVVGFVFLSFGLPFLDYKLGKGSRSYRRDKKPDSALLYSIGMTGIGLGLFISIYVLLKSGDFIRAAATFFIIVMFIITGSLMYKRREKKKLLASGLDIIDEMSGEGFEELLLEHLKKMGYKAKQTPSTGDYGTDLLMYKDKEKIVAQVKRSKSKVGVKAIQEVVGAVGYYGVDVGKVITNSYFTPQAEALAAANNIDLWDRNWLIETLSRNQGKEMAGKYEEKYHEVKLCDRCGYSMVIRNGPRGKFWGCNTFPRCRYTESLE